MKELLNVLLFMAGFIIYGGLLYLWFFKPEAFNEIPTNDLIMFALITLVSINLSDA